MRQERPASRRLWATAAAVCAVAGLAGCGSITAAERPAPAQRSPAAIPAGHQPATAPGRQPPPGGAQDGLAVPLCEARAHVDRMVATRIGGLPPSPLRAAQPTGITIADPAAVRALAAALCALPTMTHAMLSCPNDAGGAYRMEFSAAGRAFAPVTAEVSGCRFVTGLGVVRIAGAAFWHELTAVLAGHGPEPVHPGDPGLP